VPIAMRRFYEQTLCILHKFLLANQDLHHGLLAKTLSGGVKYMISSQSSMFND
jgi:hypothetical protein